MDIKYFKFNDDYLVILPDNIKTTIKKDSIFHIQCQYFSYIMNEEMAVISVDKCTPIAVPIKLGILYDEL